MAKNEQVVLGSEKELNEFVMAILQTTQTWKIIAAKEHIGLRSQLFTGSQFKLLKLTCRASFNNLINAFAL